VQILLEELAVVAVAEHLVADLPVFDRERLRMRDAQEIPTVVARERFGARSVAQ
jgi:hypothetical protein